MKEVATVTFGDGFKVCLAQLVRFRCKNGTIGTGDVVKIRVGRTGRVWVHVDPRRWTPGDYDQWPLANGGMYVHPLVEGLGGGAILRPGE